MNKMFKKILAVAAVTATAACLSVSAFAAGETATHTDGSVSVNGYTVVENATQYTVMIFKDGFEITDPETGVTTYDTDKIYYINQGPSLGELVTGMLVKATTVSGVTSNDLPVGTYTVRIGNDAGAATDITLEVEEETVTIIYGDVNDDGDVTRKDKTLLIKYLLDPENVVINKAASDVNSDGDVTRKDKTLLIKYLLDPENVVIPSK